MRYTSLLRGKADTRKVSFTNSLWLLIYLLRLPVGYSLGVSLMSSSQPRSQRKDPGNEVGVHLYFLTSQNDCPSSAASFSDPQRWRNDDKWARANADGEGSVWRWPFREGLLRLRRRVVRIWQRQHKHGMNPLTTVPLGCSILSDPGVGIFAAGPSKPGKNLTEKKFTNKAVTFRSIYVGFTSYPHNLLLVAFRGWDWKQSSIIALKADK